MFTINPITGRFDKTGSSLASNPNDKGYFVDDIALNTALPVGQLGRYATVGSTDTFWIRDLSGRVDTNQVIAPKTYKSYLNPIVNVITTSDIDTYAGGIVTLTATGNSQTLPNPTNLAPGLFFTVVNNNTSTFPLTVNGEVIEPGEGIQFIRDGTVWAGIEISENLFERVLGVIRPITLTDVIDGQYIQTLITDAGVIANITNFTNWSGDNYIGSLVGLVENNYYYDGAYEYKFDGTTLYRASTKSVASDTIYRDNAQTFSQVYADNNLATNNKPKVIRFVDSLGNRERHFDAGSYVNMELYEIYIPESTEDSPYIIYTDDGVQFDKMPSFYGHMQVRFHSQTVPVWNGKEFVIKASNGVVLITDSNTTISPFVMDGDNGAYGMIFLYNSTFSNSGIDGYISMINSPSLQVYLRSNSYFGPDGVITGDGTLHIYYNIDSTYSVTNTFFTGTLNETQLDVIKGSQQVLTSKTVTGSVGTGVGYNKTNSEYINPFAHESEIQGLAISSTEVAISGYFAPATVASWGVGLLHGTKYWFEASGSMVAYKTSRYAGETDNDGGFLLVNEQEQGKDGGIMITPTAAIQVGYYFEPILTVNDFGYEIKDYCEDVINEEHITVGTYYNPIDGLGGWRNGFLQRHYSSGTPQQTYKLTYNNETTIITKVAYNTSTGEYWIIINNDNLPGNRRAVAKVSSNMSTIEAYNLESPIGSKVDISSLYYSAIDGIVYVGGMEGTAKKGVIFQIDATTFAISNYRNINVTGAQNQQITCIKTKTNTGTGLTEVIAGGNCHFSGAGSTNGFVVVLSADLATTLGKQVFNYGGIPGEYLSEVSDVYAIDDTTDANGYSVIACGYGKGALYLSNYRTKIWSLTSRLFKIQERVGDSITSFNDKIGLKKISRSINTGKLYFTGGISDIVSFAGQGIVMSADWSDGAGIINDVELLKFADSSNNYTFVISEGNIAGEDGFIVTFVDLISGRQRSIFLRQDSILPPTVGVCAGYPNISMVALNKTMDDGANYPDSATTINNVALATNQKIAYGPYTWFNGAGNIYAINTTFSIPAIINTPYDGRAQYPIYTSVSSPERGNDSTDSLGLGVYFPSGSKRLNTTTGVLYESINDTTGNAVREQLSSGNYVWDASITPDFADFVSMTGLGLKMQSADSQLFKVNLTGTGHYIEQVGGTNFLPKIDFVSAISTSISIRDIIINYPPHGLENVNLVIYLLNGLTINDGNTYETFCKGDNAGISSSDETHVGVFVGIANRWTINLQDRSSYRAHLYIQDGGQVTFNMSYMGYLSTKNIYNNTGPVIVNYDDTCFLAGNFPLTVTKYLNKISDANRQTNQTDFVWDMGLVQRQEFYSTNLEGRTRQYPVEVTVFMEYSTIITGNYALPTALTFKQKELHILRTLILDSTGVTLSEIPSLKNLILEGNNQTSAGSSYVVNATTILPFIKLEGSILRNQGDYPMVEQTIAQTLILADYSQLQTSGATVFNVSGGAVFNVRMTNGSQLGVSTISGEVGTTLNIFHDGSCSIGAQPGFLGTINYYTMGVYAPVEILTSHTPTDAGTSGQVSYDSGYKYTCLYNGVRIREIVETTW